MKILKTLENTPFIKIIGYTLLIAVALATPVTVWVTQQETKLASKAYFEKPKIVTPIKKYGSPSEGNPRIDLIWPFLGKIGDAVLIEGENFGNNPNNKKLFLNKFEIPEENLLRWTPELIEFTLPDNASSGNIGLQIGAKGASWAYPFTVYTLQTQVQITENNDIIQVFNAPKGAKLQVFYQEGSEMESNQLNHIQVASDKTIISLLLKDENNQSIPFFVEPEEFGF
ncbi:hypothetical protein COT75_04235 [Candidatus Beckwithbacteria bacterium CG10_big_fil_rev_8_21_14_0_10_34_10]|uniref:IPT/TIG domain-containing protein n=1 Tax=Candidatus Beckwithbacteria bacterium CG10_big_fil_rev_8_21_14_0_10_34_10 TaxID=1974495 RepID=A0A2H0WAJ3_9BACT|nr:MAG: hypothetical protein COT75_04235 [Candidatus Beckwithbacteria bacterium CG10_big_fil_rev_8_21_14_0_10_34_10]